MSDTSQGEGWWQASDLRWYPPELHADPEYRARYEQPLPPAAPPTAPPAAPPLIPDPAPGDGVPAHDGPTDDTDTDTDDEDDDDEPTADDETADDTDDDVDTEADDDEPTADDADTDDADNDDEADSDDEPTADDADTDDEPQPEVDPSDDDETDDHADTDDEADEVEPTDDPQADDRADTDDEPAADDTDTDDTDTDTDVDPETDDDADEVDPSDDDETDDQADTDDEPQPVAIVEMPPPGVPPGPRFEQIPHPGDAPFDPDGEALPREPEPSEGRRGLLFAAIGAALVGAIAVVVFLVASTGGGDDGEGDQVSDVDRPTPVGQTATPTPGLGALPGIYVTTSAVGTTADPAAFGEVYGWPQWRGSVLEVVDAIEAGLVADFDEAPAEGSSHVAVIYEVTYVGGGLSAFEPFLVDSPGTDVIERFACILDTAKLDAIGVATGIFELVPGQTVRLAVCLEVPEGAVGQMRVSLDNVNVFEEPVVFGPGGSLLEPLDPPPLDAVDRPLETVPYGTLLQDEGWQGTVSEVFDATAAGVVSEFAQPVAEGFVYLAVVYEVTNATDEDADFIPIRVTGIGSAVYEAFNSCFLDAEAIAEFDVEINRFELASGETVRVASCLEVPVDEVGSFVVRMQNSFATGGVFLLFPGSG
ncbi:MAG: hypothetical protein AAF480_01945 [Actinomycetota bacterium]